MCYELQQKRGTRVAERERVEKRAEEREREDWQPEVQPENIFTHTQTEKCTMKKMLGAFAVRAHRIPDHLPGEDFGGS